MRDFLTLVKEAQSQGRLSEKLSRLLVQFYLNYKNTLLPYPEELQKIDNLFPQLLQRVIEQEAHPYPFQGYHEKIRSPFDYYQFGQDFIRPLIDFKDSHVEGKEQVDRMVQQVRAGDNVILLSNHQTEADPQIISLLLEKEHPRFVEQIIYVAGDRVITDPMAVPLSLGRNLICIYSKRHIDYPPEEKAEKLLHNQRTMKRMAQLLAEGGKCIYVAPSGGRDRASSTGKVELSPFDPQSIEMVWLMAQQGKRPSHFYPFALWTYPVLPPPLEVETELGEERRTQRSPVSLAFGAEIEMDKLPGSDNPDKKMRRQLKAEAIWKLVLAEYTKIATSS